MTCACAGTIVRNVCKLPAPAGTEAQPPLSVAAVVGTIIAILLLAAVAYMFWKCRSADGEGKAPTGNVTIRFVSPITFLRERARERKRVRRDEAALRFQSLYRGFAVRRTINELRVRKRAHEEFMDLRTYAATKIQATFRGCLSRRLVRAKKVELENFIKFYRAMDRVMQPR